MFIPVYIPGRTQTGHISIGHIGTFSVIEHRQPTGAVGSIVFFANVSIFRISGEKPVRPKKRRTNTILLTFIHPGNIHTGSHTYIYIYIQRILDRGKTSGRCITQLAKISIDHNFIELTADERILKFYKIPLVEMSRSSFLARSKGPAPSPALQPAPASTRS